MGKAKKTFKYNSRDYQIFQFLGTPLNKYLEKNTLTKEQQYTLAIKIAYAVHHLHAGTYSKKGIRYAHLDLKPRNICIDKNSNVHLIDYGESEEIDGTLPFIKGTRSYLPFSDLFEVEKQDLDIFALLRILYLPENFKSYQIADDYRVSYNRWIFSDELLFKAPLLEDFLDTADGKTRSISAFDVVCRLILFKYNLASTENVKKALDDPETFNNCYQHLTTLGLNQAKYIQNTLDDPQQFDENCKSWFLETIQKNTRKRARTASLPNIFFDASQHTQAKQRIVQSTNLSDIFFNRHGGSLTNLATLSAIGNEVHNERGALIPS
ncbi:protein kinase domain-containing protein [Piscirickettsia salmonis]|uniref:Protein kinase domain protein n=1 Tax=Piscirickettsia salmonis TaxID=1238 RepID=A0A9Q6LIB9_PISSA|nr:serine/threonine-protein kinase [Piscirickettsia salmonis]ERL60891.1 tyrosine kinase family protein [Piscirickettsia salmonis LF-89 = ATCC VR-1361]QGN76127.1 Protein kinase domain protein [Piscirickettsia salmonis]QGN79690.1 Protein kinase domain protein [Piscirickettsia salmonis]QGN83279.1 Protein kinase domain protein [Piscirickettsia salmonis]QGN86793.1 Protein kinase domain protein [Piscirickettsia salmonis]